MPEINMHKPRRNSFYLFIGILGLFAIITGFFTTYTQPVLHGTFRSPLVIHVHGFLALAWVGIFLIQVIAIRHKNISLHKTIGPLGLFIAIGIILTLLPVGFVQVKKELSAGLGDTAISGIIGVVTTGLLFGFLVGLGYYHRKKPQVHKRYLVLATIILLWPAWFRFRHYFPGIPRPDIWFAVVLADSLILLAWITDAKTCGKIHPVLLYGGLLIICEHIVEVLLFDSYYWRIMAKVIYALFQGH